MKYSSIITFNLDNFKTPAELEEVLIAAGLGEHIDANQLFTCKEDGIDKIYLDVNTGNAIAYHQRGLPPMQVIPMQEFIKHMIDQPCVSEIITRKPIDLDEVLDKIYKKGMTSLTDRERQFLNQQSPD
jgi:hypothetical protein